MYFYQNVNQLLWKFYIDFSSGNKSDYKGLIPIEVMAGTCKEKHYNGSDKNCSRVVVPSGFSKFCAVPTKREEDLCVV